MSNIVAVISKHYMPALGIIRSLGEAGYCVDLIYIVSKNGTSEIASASKYVNRTVEIKESTDNNMVEQIRAQYTEFSKKIFLFPADDFSVTFIGRNYEKFSSFLFPTTDKKNDILEITNKSVQNKLALNAGLLAAKEWCVDFRKNESVPDDVQFPCFCKPEISILGSKQEMMKCENRTVLLSQIDRMRNYNRNRSILIQEFLNVEQEYDVSGLSINGKVMIAAVIKKLQVAAYNKGPTEMGVVCNPTVLESIYNEIERFVSSISYNRIFDIELFYADGKFYFNELNVRPTGVIYAVTASGCNLPAMLVSALFEDNIYSLTTSKTDNIVFFSEKVAYEDYLHGYISDKKLKEMKRNADVFLLENKKDAEPFKRFQSSVRKKVLKKKIKTLLSVGRKSKK